MQVNKQSEKTRKPRILTIICILALMIMTASAGVMIGRHLSHPHSATSPETPPQVASPTPAQEPQSSSLPKVPTPTEAPTTPTPVPTCTDGTQAPDGTCLHPASIQWLPDLLPDPREVDRTDGDAVCSAYIITHDTWDASRDVTNAYASIRASVYETPDLQARHTPTPDLEKGQGDFLPLIPNRSHTTVTIDSLVTEGKEPYPDRTPGKWERLVTYTRTYADNSHEPIQAFVFLTLTQQDDGTWAVTDAKWHQNR